MLSELDIPALQEWFNCSAEQKKEKRKKDIKSIMFGSALLRLEGGKLGKI